MTDACRLFMAPTVGGVLPRPGEARPRLRKRRVRIRETPDPTRRRPGHHDRVKILLVEDEESIAVPLTEGLRREGFTVERAATGAAALEAGPADCVLLDYIGSKPPMGVYIPIGRAATLYYFLHFFLLWYTSRKEKTLPLPESISKAVLESPAGHH